MRLKCFAIPALSPEEATEDVSRFLASHRVLTIDRQFVADGEASYWAICVTYQQAAETRSSKRPRVDYREVLSESDFAIYARLRDLRKTLAEREAAPPYAVFTNEQLATIARQRPGTTAQLAAISGIGPGRVDKYGERVLELLRTTRPTENPSADAHAFRRRELAARLAPMS